MRQKKSMGELVSGEYVGWTFLSVLKLECWLTDRNVHPTSFTFWQRQEDWVPDKGR